MWKQLEKVYGVTFRPMSSAESMHTITFFPSLLAFFVDPSG